jgi:methionyl aminopeptidase
MIRIKTPEELERMRRSGRIAAEVLQAIARQVVPGVTTGDLDAFAAERIREHGACSAFLKYRGYPGHICLSLNEAVVHGIPGARKIALGDLVSIDVGIRYAGYIGDTAATVMAGVTDPDVMRLVAAAQQALAAGIAAARVGGRLSDISHAIESCAAGHGFSVVHEFVGHGVGREMHEDPQVPNFGPPGQGPRLKAGMTLALEPMLNLGGSEVDVQNDGWTVLTRDRKPSAHFEHTIALREEGAEILTVSG